jgi:hypothetical protein
MRFRPHEEVPFEVVAQAPAKVPHEMIAAYEIAAAGEATAAEKWLIKTQTFPTDTGL